MIENYLQYRITLNQAERFRKALADLDKHGLCIISPNENVHPRLQQAMREGLESQLHNLEAEIKEYEDQRDLR